MLVITIRPCKGEIAVNPYSWCLHQELKLESRISNITFSSIAIIHFHQSGFCWSQAYGEPRRFLSLE